MTTRPVAAWTVPLDGHVFDLEDLPVYLSGSGIAVRKSSSGYLLELPARIAGTAHDNVIGLANAFLELLNGAARLVIPSYRPITLADGAFFGVDEDGTVVTTVLRVHSAEMRCKAGTPTVDVNGVAQPDTRDGQLARMVEAAESNVGARDALVILGRLSPSWSELYLVYELVQANVGDRMYQDKWISRAEGTRFSRTANSYTTLGRASRHGKQTAESPSDPMTQQDASALMRSLVSSWLSSMQFHSRSSLFPGNDVAWERK